MYNIRPTCGEHLSFCRLRAWRPNRSTIESSVHCRRGDHSCGWHTRRGRQSPGGSRGRLAGGWTWSHCNGLDSGMPCAQRRSVCDRGPPRISQADTRCICAFCTVDLLRGFLGLVTCLRCNRADVIVVLRRFRRSPRPTAIGVFRTQATALCFCVPPKAAARWQERVFAVPNSRGRHIG